MVSGQELTCHYRYDMRDASKIPELQWYVEEWDRLTEGVSEPHKCVENGELGEDGNQEVPAPDSLPENFIREIIDGVIERVMNSSPILNDTEYET